MTECGWCVTVLLLLAFSARCLPPCVCVWGGVRVLLFWVGAGESMQVV